MLTPANGITLTTAPVRCDPETFEIITKHSFCNDGCVDIYDERDITPIETVFL